MEVKILISLILLIFLCGVVNATHFRFGTISWKVPDATLPHKIQFYSSFTFRRSYFTNANVGSTIVPGNFNFGDGSASVKLQLLVTTINKDADWASGTFTTTYSYPKGVVANYTAYHSSVGRILELNNNPNLKWNVSCTVSVGRTVVYNGATVYNTAPVSNNLPIVTVYSSYINKFNVISTDAEGQTLTYSLGTPVDMGGSSLKLAPNLTVSTDGTVTFDTRGIANGYWCTQIKFSDGYCYSVVDFLIYVTPQPRTCDSSCSSTAGVSCTADTDCGTCGVSSPCELINPPTLVSPPTPVDGTNFDVQVNSPVSVSWSAYSPAATSVTATMSSSPAAAVITTTVTGQRNNQTLTWTPTTSDVGVYVITLGCSDSNGQSCTGQSSFSITVSQPFCGNGGTITPAGCDTSKTGCGCTCASSGFDVSTKCYDCLSGYYGASCTACPSCANGYCSDGISGAGGCTCYSGWQGANCSYPLSNPCSTSTADSVTASVSTGTYLNPNSETVYMTASTSKSLSLSFTTAYGSGSIPVNSLDILFLVDVTQTITTTQLNNLKSTYASSFFDGMTGSVPDTQFGLATFADEPNYSYSACTSDYPYRLSSPLSSKRADFISTMATLATTSLGCDSQSGTKKDSQLDALVQAATGAGVGWRSTSFKVVVLLTDAPFWEGDGTNGYNTRADVRAALIAANIVPIFATSTGDSTYTTLVGTATGNLGFGVSVTATAGTWSNVYNTISTAITTATSSCKFVVAQDTYGFVSGTPSTTQSTKLSTYTSSVTLKYSGGLESVQTYPVLQFNAMGWGTSSVTVQVNRAPSASVSSATTRKGLSSNVLISGSDVDGNALTVYLLTLPTNGYLTVNSSVTTRVKIGTQYNIPDGTIYAGFYYTPNTNTYVGNDTFLYYISDGCSKTANVSYSIQITDYNYPPVAYDGSLTTNENTNTDVVMNATDVETPLTQLTFMVLSLPDATLGVLKRKSGAAVAVNQVMNAGENTIVFVPVTYACCDYATFTYAATDAGGATSNVGSVEVEILAVNQAPTASAANITVARGSRTAITFNSWDPDHDDKSIFAVLSATSGFSTTAGANISTSATTTISTVTVDSNGNAIATIYYTAAANQATGGTVTFQVTDSSGATSSKITVYVSIKANTAPTANPAGPITVFQDSSSATWNLNGTDADAADANTLKIQLASLPTKGTLTQVGYGDISASATLPFTLTNPNIVYRTNSTGSDTFNFQVVDLMGSVSSVQAVTVAITAVNHAPTATFSPVSVNEDVLATWQVSPYDQDGDTLSVIITSLSRGSLYQYDNTPITKFPTTLTDSGFHFKFQGGLHEYGSPYANFTFYVSDNQGKPNSNSSVVTGVVNVIFVNNPPVPVSVFLNIKENAGPVNFTLNATDIETPNTVSAYLYSIPNTLGTLKTVTGDTLSARTLVSAPRIVTFYPNSYQYGTTTFSFGAYDGTAYSDSASPATATITITHVNHAPSGSANPATATRSVPLSISLVVSDNDVGDNLTVTISSFTGKGVLSYNNVPITASYTLPTQFNIPASNKATVTLSYLAPSTAKGTNFDSFSFYVTDQGGLTAATTTVSISIASDNAPTANPAGPLPVTQDFMSVPLPLNGTDVDVADANSLSVVIVTLPSSGYLYYNSGSVKITVAGTVLPSSVSTVTYLTTQRGTDSFTFAVQDLVNTTSSALTVSIPITNTNHAPSAYWVGTAVANEDTTLDITNIQATDPDGDTVIITVLTGPASGILYQYDGTTVCNAPCNVTDSSYRLKFKPAPNGNSVNGQPYANITFAATDKMVYSTSVTGAFYITPVDDAPVAVSSIVTTKENENVTITLNATDIDTPMDQVSVTIQSVPSTSFGTLTYLNGTALQFGSVMTGSLVKQLVFVPTQYANGITSFSFSLNDGELSSSTATVTVNITSVRQDPVCSVSPAAYSAVGRNTSTSHVLNVFDPDQGETYTFYMTSYAYANGGDLVKTSTGVAISAASTVLASGVTTTNYYGTVGLTYNVAADEASTYVRISFVVFDGVGNSSECYLQLNSSNNIPPVALPVLPLSINEDNATGVIILNGTDADNYGSPLTVLITSLPQNGQLQQDSPRQVISSKSQLTSGSFGVIYTPTKLWYGNDSFTFVVQDIVGATSPETVVKITVAHINHAPKISGGSTVTTLEDTPILISQISTSDDDGDQVSVYIKYPPARGSFAQADGTAIASYPAKITNTSYYFKFSPGANENGDAYANFTVYASDGQANSDPLVVFINVTPVDDPPVAVDVVVAANEQVVASGISFVLNATDIDTPQSGISASVNSLPSSTLGSLTYTNGTAVAVGDIIPYPRTVQFVPVAYTYGNTQFSFIVKDGTSYSAASATVYVEITHVNHDPTANTATVTAVRGVPLVISLSGSDPDSGDVFRFVLDSITPGAGGVLVNANGDTLSSASTNIITNVTNTASKSFSTSITYTAPDKASGNNFANLTFHIVDELNGASNATTITIDISPNSAPIAVPATFVAYQDTASSYEVLYGTDADVADANDLILVITTLPQLGSLIVNSTFNITAKNTTIPSGTSVSYYTTSRGSDSFTYYVQDNLGAQSSIVTAYVTIINVNHPPTAVFHGPATGAENTNVTINQIVLSDPDGDTVSVYLVSIPDSGTLTQYDGTPITSASESAPALVTNTNGWFMYVPATYANGDPLASFTFYGDDGQGKNNSHTDYISGNITVTAVNQAPVAVDGLTSALENAADILITLNATDVDTNTNNVSVYLTSLPDSSIGVLVNPDTKVAIQLLEKIPSRQVLLQLVEYTFGETSFTFFANDGSLDSTSAGIQTIAVEHVNQAPTASATNPVSVSRAVPTAITLNLFDHDTPENFTVSVISYSSLGGYFSYGNVTFEDISTTSPFVIAQVPKSSSGNTIEVYFTAPANMFGNNFAFLALQVADASGATSNITNITVNVLEGTKPSGNAAGPIQFNEETTSSTFSLNGTDVDVADVNNLHVVISSLPSKATLYAVSTDGTPDTAITVTGAVLSNPAQVYLVGNNLTYGSDSFTFKLVDAVNQESTPSTVSITIVHVNHAPVANAIINNGTMNSNLTFQVFGTDVDGEQPSVYITATPSVGYIFQNDGTLVSTASVASPVLVTDIGGKLIYMAPTNQWGLPITSISIQANDNTDTANALSAVTIIPISMNRIDLAPTVSNLTLSMNMNGALNFTIVAVDPQSYDTFATIISFPLNGNLYRSDGSAITTTNPITKDRFVSYVPPQKAYDDGVTAYASFTYSATAISGTGLTSNVGTANIFVNKTIGAPVYTGQTTFTILQNNNLTMLLTGSSETGNYGITILSSVASDRGLLYTEVCMTTDECSNDYITGNYDMDSSDMDYRVRYTPPTDQYGTGYANFTIVVTDAYGKSDPVTLTINVQHVNAPPTIIPWTYDTLDENGVMQTYNWSSAIVNIIEGNDAIIAWKISDKDTPQMNLTSIVYAVPYKGALFYVNSTADGYVAGDSLSISGSVVTSNDDTLFRVVYRPVAGKSGNNYATFSLIGYDQIDQSSRISLKINVRHINLAPWVQVEQPNWNATAGSAVIITGVSVNDTDASYYSELFQLSLTKADGSAAPSGSLLELTYFTNSTCLQQNDVTLNCTSTLTSLNQLLTQISVTAPTAGDYVVTVYINDLGAGSSNRSIDHLNGTGVVYVTVTSTTTATTSSSSSSSVMTAAVASAAGVGAAAAAGVWRYMKKKSPPTIDFFGMESVTTQVTNNPLFEDAQHMSFSNALYEADN